MAKQKKPKKKAPDLPHSKTGVTKSIPKQKPGPKKKSAANKQRRDIIESLGESILITSRENAIKKEGDIKHFVRFRLERHHFAFPLDQVERTIRMVAFVPLPDESPWVAGMMNMHGNVVPVLDLRKRLGYPPKTPHPDDRLLVARGKNRVYAFIVDEVMEVMELHSKQVEILPDFLEESQPLRAVIRGEERLVLVLDVTRLEPRNIKEAP